MKATVTINGLLHEIEGTPEEMVYLLGHMGEGKEKARVYKPAPASWPPPDAPKAHPHPGPPAKHDWDALAKTFADRGLDVYARGEVNKFLISEGIHTNGKVKQWFKEKVLLILDKRATEPKPADSVSRADESKALATEGYPPGIKPLPFTK